MVGAELADEVSSAGSLCVGRFGGLIVAYVARSARVISGVNQVPNVMRF